MRAAIGFGFGAAMVLAQACASAPPPGPGGVGLPMASGYPSGQCAPNLQLEAENQASTGRGTSPGGLGTGTDSLVATYRPGARTAPAQLSAKTTIESADNPASQVEWLPSVACPGKPGETAESAPPVD